MEQMMQHPNRRTETSWPGNNSQTARELHSGCEDAEGCLGKSEKDFRRMHHNQKDPTPTGAEQFATTRLVGG